MRKSVIFYAGTILLITGPLLLPGYILTLDMVFTPTLPMPDSVASNYLFRAGLHYLSLVMPSDVLQKLLLLSVLLLSCIGMHRLIKSLDPAAKGEGWGIYAASIFFMANPFTYSRFMAGQYSVLLGYALLPWFVRLMIDFGRLPSLRTALKLGGLATVIGMVSIHSLGSIALLALSAAGVGLWRCRHRLKMYLRFGLVAAGVFLAVNSYWLVPFIAGSGATSRVVEQFTAADTAAFATTGQDPIDRLANIIRLQGFWAEGQGLYLLPQDRMMLWGLIALVIIGLVIRGGVALWRKQPAVVILFAASGIATMLLAAGLMEPLARNLPLLAGYREPHKLVAVVALAYGTFLAFGIKAILENARRRSETAYAAVAVLALFLPLLLTKTMLFGFDGQLTPRQYPADWYSLNESLKSDPKDLAVVFLPWHQYMSFSFSGRIIANPAPAFFSKPTFASADPELGGATSGRGTGPQKIVHDIVTAPDKTGLAQKLATQNIKYVILAKELDYREYRYLNGQPGLELIKDYPAATLYQNQAWRER